ncbi:hypothetical protein BDV98DRAFT_648690 [Pterulicium gracile]|uniref:Sugar phosphate transporter domain-containing protein n=1 Tax=Pterulicium gracile TaxID=1884261 RepID=A0A5C3QTF4_9AGAR|nr:hypothetical protein BDV98DRAFT_648690 [Pterula gracilis]
MAAPHREQKAESRTAVFAVVTFYLVAALAMVMANKWVLNATDAPLFFLCTQLFIAVVLFAISDAVGILPDKLTFDFKICKGLTSMVGLNVLSLSFSNFTLQYVDASFYQVARGLVLPFTVLTSFIVLHSRPSLRILIGCLVVTMGFFVGVFLDGTQVSLKGVSFGVASSVITAIHSVVIKQSLEIVDGSALLLSWYTNALSAMVLVPVFLLAGEGPAAAGIIAGVDKTISTFIWGSLLTGVIGFLMSIASLLSIKVTSPITHMVSSAVRGVAAFLLGVWLFGDLVTTGRATSVGLILAGSIYYTWVKHKESQPASSTTSSNDASYERVKMNDVETGAPKERD